jgi:hypothetical protein
MKVKTGKRFAAFRLFLKSCNVLSNIDAKQLPVHALDLRFQLAV